MAIFEYACPKCNKVVEIQHHYSEKKRIKCEECKKVMKKIISTGGFLLYGGGYYRGSVKE